MSKEKLIELEKNFTERFFNNKTHKDIVQFLDSELNDVFVSSDERENKAIRKAKATMIIHGLTAMPECVSCGKPAGFDPKTKQNNNTRIYATAFGSFRKFCSASCALSSDQKKENLHKTMVARYGEDYRSIILKGNKQSDEAKARSRASREALWKSRTDGKYTHHRQLPEFKNKIELDKLKRYLSALPGVDGMNSLAEIKDTVLSVINEYENEHSIAPTRQQIMDRIGNPKFSKQCFNRSMVVLGISVEFLQHQASGGQSELNTFLTGLGLETKFCDRSSIPPYELDILIPSCNLAIEFNGVWCHSENSGKSKDYHLNKTSMANAKGVSVMHIWDFEWYDKRHILESMIKAKCGVLSSKIYARRCTVKEVPSKEAKEFCESNHLQGYAPSKFSIGLYHENELVMCATFGKPRFNKKYEWELIRLCSKLDTSIVGGLSRILASFKAKTKGESLVTYSERRLSGLSPAYASHFTLVDITGPGWFGYKDGVVYNRLSLTKSKLMESYKESYDDSISAIDNAMKLGYDIVWDCGQWVYEL